MKPRQGEGLLFGCVLGLMMWSCCIVSLMFWQAIR